MQLQAWWWSHNYLNWRKSTADRSFSEVQSLQVAVGSLVTQRVTFEFIVSKVCGPITSTSNSTHICGSGIGLGDVWWAGLYRLWFKFLKRISNSKIISGEKSVRLSFSLSSHTYPKYIYVFDFFNLFLKELKTYISLYKKIQDWGLESKAGRGETF